MNLINITLAALLTENVVLTKFLGICPFIGVSNKRKSALSMGLSVMLVVVLSSIITWSLYHFLLVPTKTEYLRTVLFVLVIASLVQLLEIILKRYLPHIHKMLGIYLPLITTNCAVLGIVLLNINSDYNFIEMLVYSISSSLGFTLVIYLFSSMREKINNSDVPKPFKGHPIALITAAIMALLFSRYL
jgi:electron transport complex protein RnfA